MRRRPLLGALEGQVIKKAPDRSGAFPHFLLWNLCCGQTRDLADPVAGDAHHRLL